MLRTHTGGELRQKDVKKNVTLCGWVHSRRDHGGVIFIDLRDRYGLTQIVFNPEFNKKTHQLANDLRREDVIQVTGIVRERAAGMKNSKLSTGEIEVFISDLTVVNRAQTPPLEVDEYKTASEEFRLQYRYLDLRRPAMQEKLILRHRVVQALREYLNSQQFLEIETPLLIRHTPEGARDFVVPSRLHPGKFYSLPQSPQLYKQLLMIAGLDRYYQIARALRDEDLRMDRQPEHTQLDLEMSFVTEEDIFQLTEQLLVHLFKTVLGKSLSVPFPRLKYDDCLEKYGIDKPDIRFGLELKTVTDIVKESDFQIIKNVIAKGGIVKGITVEKGATFTRTQLESYIALAQQLGASGLVWMKVTKEGLESNVAKFFSAAVQKKLIAAMKAKPGDLLLMVADKPKQVNEVMAKIRLRLGEELQLIDKNVFQFCFITDFPMFEWNEEEQKWDAMHHIFTMPKEEHIPLLDKDPGKVYARLYDLVLNGTELYSGSVRTYKPELQQKLMEIIGMTPQQAKEKFGFLLEAYRYGAPIHAGFGLGIDRLVALMAGISDIREVIAFPKTKSMENPMDNCPSELDQKQLKELHISVTKSGK